MTRGSRSRFAIAIGALHLVSIGSAHSALLAQRRPTPVVTGVAIELAARPLTSGPAEFEPLHRNIWSIYDQTDSIRVAVRLGATFMRRSAGTCQLLVQYLVQVDHALSTGDETIQDLPRSRPVWLPP
jgi:hypothetical protein